MTAEILVRTADWERDETALRHVRTRVFIEEQRVPPECEWDEEDARCVHVLALANEIAIGTGRITAAGQIGRMAVLADWRGRNVGARMLEALLNIARTRGDTGCRLDAQVSAIGFYERYGFAARGEEFMDAGIPHRRMELTFAP